METTASAPTGRSDLCLQRAQQDPTRRARGDDNYGWLHHVTCRVQFNDSWCNISWHCAVRRGCQYIQPGIELFCLLATYHTRTRCRSFCFICELGILNTCNISVFLQFGFFDFVRAFLPALFLTIMYPYVISVNFSYYRACTSPTPVGRSHI